MKITIDWLTENDACSEGVDWFKKQDKSDAVKVLKSLMAEDKLDWTNWTIARVFNETQRVQYAIFAAEQVIDIFEKKYPDDDRPRKAIEAAKKYLKNPSVAAESARSAESAAWSAAWRAAWRAAESAAWRAAESAARSAAESAARSAAESAAWSAAWRAAENEMKTRILNYGISLLEGKP